VMLDKDVIGRTGRGCVHVVGACHTMRGPFPPDLTGILQWRTL
jgi:hypothetical protein